MRWNHLQQVVFCLWSILAVLIVIAALNIAKAHIMGHPEWDNWLKAQRTPDERNTICCDKTDAYLLDDEDVRVRNGEYEGRINGQWIRFPNTGQGNPGNTVLGAVGNPTGSAVAWVYGGRAFCFLPGTGI